MCPQLNKEVGSPSPCIASSCTRAATMLRCLNSASGHSAKLPILSGGRKPMEAKQLVRHTGRQEIGVWVTSTLQFQMRTKPRWAWGKIDMLLTVLHWYLRLSPQTLVLIYDRHTMTMILSTRGIKIYSRVYSFRFFLEHIYFSHVSHRGRSSYNATKTKL